MEKRESNVLPSVFSVPDFSSMGRCVLDISTREFNTIYDPCLRDTNCVYSKGGWLLMRPEHFTGRVTGPHFLVNPVTGVKIGLPTNDGLNGRGAFTFSIVDGTPDRVVHVNNTCMNTPGGYGISIQVIRPGEEEWDVYVFGRCHSYTTSIDVALVGTQVLCIDSAGKITSFDLLAGTWATFAGAAEWPIKGRRYRVESEAEVLSVHCNFPFFSSFKFLRLDLQRREWVELNDFELENTSWFLGSPCSFYTHEEGKKVYTFYNSYDGPRPPICEPGMPRKRRVVPVRPLGSDVECNVYVHDLVTNVTESLLPVAFHTKTAHWIDANFLG